MEIQKIKDVVEEILKEDTRARNSDTWLIFQTLRAMGFNIFIDFKQLREMPSFETITRSRRYIQNNEGKYLSDEQMIKLRKEQEIKHKEYFS